MYFLIFALLFPTVAFADFYIVNKDNQVIARTNYVPNISELDKRQEFAVESNIDVSISKADYKNGKIVAHVETAGEKKEREDYFAKIKEEEIVHERMEKQAYDSLKAEGKNFKFLKDEDFK